MFKFVRATVSALVALLSCSHCVCFITVVNRCVFEQINYDDDDDDDDSQSGPAFLVLRFQRPPFPVTYISTATVADVNGSIGLNNVNINTAFFRCLRCEWRQRPLVYCTPR